MGAYQTFSDRPGGSKSAQKLERLHLPKSLRGKRVLDLGCNEGYFAIEARRRGAQFVLGLDHSARAIKAAEERASGLSNIEFRHGDMSALSDDQKFDYVFLLSALHYIDDPAALFRRIRERLAPEGSLILECGVAPGAGRTVKRVLRSIDDRLFPTLDLLRDVWLAGYTIRWVGASVDQDGDPIPRNVFHCSGQKTSVIFIPGEGHIGKTALAAQISNAVTISVDGLFSPIRTTSAKRFVPEIQSRYDEERKRAGQKSIRLGWSAMRDDEQARKFFTDTIVRSILACRSAPLIVVEGYVLSDLLHNVEAALGPDFRCWTVAREAPSVPESILIAAE